MPSDAQRVSARAAEILADTIAGMRRPRWTPLPHQIPPPGDWYGWILLAGRGAGKTDACARYVTEHVQGPPCLPGPTPHWIGIIAPTQGDAATSCVNGPSGLKVHDPTCRMSTVPGGTVVRWPNGSEAKLFGANSEEDTERLRSGGNRCVGAGSLVRTEHGEVPIEDVRVGDRVWTRNGLRRVLAVWDNGVREVRRYDHAAGSTLLTPDHEVWTVGGWKQAQSVTPDDTVFTWLTSSNTTVSGGTPVRPTPTTGTRAWDCCTGTCGPRRSGPYPQVCMYTTRTTTKETTGSITSCCSDPESTGPNTGQSAARTGTARAAGRRGTERSTGTSFARGAAGRSDRGEPLRSSGSAPSPATSATLRHEHRSSGCAACAALTSNALPAIQRAPVRASALRSTSPSSSGRRSRVYDLTVEHDHEFFADGLLVSNCLFWLEELAAWRYQDIAWKQMRFGLRSGPRPHWVASTTPKPRPLIKKLAAGMRGVQLSRATMYDNPHLPQHIRDALEEEYQNTQIGRQELMAEIIDQDENALWTHEMLDAARIAYSDLPKLTRITVGVDPSGGAGEQGIVISGKAELPVLTAGRSRLVPHGFVLADRTVQLSPSQWGRRAVQAAVDYEANDIVVETNFGGAMAVSTIRAAADHMGIAIPIREVVASRSKIARAEPVAALTEQLRWHHAGTFPQLEDQMCTWYPDLGWSPDRLDGSVWGAWHNRVVRKGSSVVQPISGAAMSRQIG